MPAILGPPSFPAAPFLPLSGPIYTFIDELNSHSLPMENANDYYIDHFGDDLVVFQTLHPENLSFVLNIREPDTITYDISMSAIDLDGQPVVFRHGDGTSFIGPQRTGWLLRQGFQPISSGLHTRVNGRRGDDFMRVAGEDWLGYFARRQFPFNGNNVLEQAIGGAPHGLAYEADNDDIAVILTVLLNKILGMPYSWPITYSLSNIGKSIDWEVNMGDQRFLSDMISNLSDVAPGFDYETTWDMKFRIASPYFYGDPTTFDVTSPGASQWSYVLDESDEAHTPFDLEFTNDGPIATHVSGYGGSSPYLAVTKGYTGGQAQFHRLDASYDFAEISNRDTLSGLTSKNLAFNLNPQHEIPVRMLPQQVNNFWSIFKPGRAIYIDSDLIFHEIQSGHRIISMTCADDQNVGELVVDFGLNQIYGTSDNIGNVEG